MKYDDGRVVCDCCSRQIVSYKVDNKTIYGDGIKAPRKFGIGFGKHACTPCQEDLKRWDILNGNIYG